MTQQAAHMFNKRQYICFKVALCLTLSLCSSLFAQTKEIEVGKKALLNGESFIYHIQPEPRGGEAYKLVYLVHVPLSAYWIFKTDFDNKFLLTNKYIEHHRLIQRKGNIVITENKYTNAPDVYFKWQSTIFPKSYRIEFKLLNPGECRQKFNYGYIKAEPMGAFTKITHVAYFDFLGVTIWAHYPWAGGMSEFLRYTARWEQETALKYKLK